MTTFLLVGAAPVAGTEQLVRRISRIADLVIAADGGAAVCLRAGVEPGIVVGDLDSLEQATARAMEERGVVVEVFSPDKDVTDLDLAVDAARARGASRLIVTGAYAGRLDHTLAAIGSLQRAADLFPVVLEPGFSAWLLHPEHRGSVVLEGSGAVVSLVALEPGTRVTCTGVKWPLRDVPVDALSSLGVSNMIVSDHATLSVESGTALVISPRMDYAEQAYERSREA